MKRKRFARHQQQQTEERKKKLANINTVCFFPVVCACVRLFHDYLPLLPPSSLYLVKSIPFHPFVGSAHTHTHTYTLAYQYISIYILRKREILVQSTSRGKGEMMCKAISLCSIFRKLTAHNVVGTSQGGGGSFACHSRCYEKSIQFGNFWGVQSLVSFILGLGLSLVVQL